MRKLLALVPLLVVVGCGSGLEEESVSNDAISKAQSKFEASGSEPNSGPSSVSGTAGEAQSED